jgi:hypothetical protein
MSAIEHRVPVGAWCSIVVRCRDDGSVRVVVELSDNELTLSDDADDLHDLASALIRAADIARAIRA